MSGVDVEVPNRLINLSFTVSQRVIVAFEAMSSPYHSRAELLRLYIRLRMRSLSVCPSVCTSNSQSHVCIRISLSIPVNLSNLSLKIMVSGIVFDYRK